MPVHEIRRDVPSVLAVIIEKVMSVLLPELSVLTLIRLPSKNPEVRYQIGLDVRSGDWQPSAKFPSDVTHFSLTSENALEFGVQSCCVKDLPGFPRSFRTFRSAHKTSSS